MIPGAWIGVAGLTLLSILLAILDRGDLPNDAAPPPAPPETPQSCLPALPELVDLFDIEPLLLTPEGIRARWKEKARAPIELLLGYSAKRPEYVNLHEEGPSGLVIGPSGSGTTEAISTMLVYLASTYPPEVVRLRLASVKQGSLWWEEFRAVPHIVSLKRALTSAERKTFLKSIVECAQEKRRIGWDGNTLDLFVIDELQFFGCEEEELLDAVRIGRDYGVGVIIGGVFGANPPGLGTVFRFGVLLGNPDHWRNASPWSIPKAVMDEFRSTVPPNKWSIPGRAILLKSGEAVSIIQMPIVGRWVKSRGGRFRNSRRDQWVRALKEASKVG